LCWGSPAEFLLVGYSVWYYFPTNRVFPVVDHLLSVYSLCFAVHFSLKMMFWLLIVGDLLGCS